MAGALAEPNIAETGESLVSLTMQAVYAHIGVDRRAIRTPFPG